MNFHSCTVSILMARYLPCVLAATDGTVLPVLFDAQGGSDGYESCFMEAILL